MNNASIIIMMQVEFIQKVSLEILNRHKNGLIQNPCWFIFC